MVGEKGDERSRKDSEKFSLPCLYLPQPQPKDRGQRNLIDQTGLTKWTCGKSILNELKIKR